MPSYKTEYEKAVEEALKKATDQFAEREEKTTRADTVGTTGMSAEEARLKSAVALYLHRTPPHD
jgi:hypothetical protein